MAARHQILWAMLLLTIGGVGVAYVVQRTRTPETPGPKPIPPARGDVRPFALTDQRGETLDGAALKGTVWIANFVFTRCPGPCPKMCRQVQGLQKDLPAEVRFVSFSIDPDFDTVEVLKAYAILYEADPARWMFLTGPKETIWKLSMDDFKIGVWKDADDPQDRPDHDPRFVLVDRRGKIRGHYPFDDEDAMKRLREEALRLVKDK